MKRVLTVDSGDNGLGKVNQRCQILVHLRSTPLNSTTTSQAYIVLDHVAQVRFRVDAGVWAEEPRRARGQISTGRVVLARASQNNHRHISVRLHCVQRVHQVVVLLRTTNCTPHTTRART